MLASVTLTMDVPRCCLSNVFEWRKRTLVASSPLPLRSSLSEKINNPHIDGITHSKTLKENYTFYLILPCTFWCNMQHEKHLISCTYFDTRYLSKSVRFDGEKEQVEPEWVKTTKAITLQWRIIKGSKIHRNRNNYCCVRNEWCINYIFIFIHELNIMQNYINMLT